MSSSQDLTLPSFAGAVNIERCEVLTALNKHVDLSKLVMGVNIYEDMYSPLLSGAIHIKDSVDVHNILPLVGEEYVDITISTPGIDTKFSGRYYIYKMSNRTEINDKTMVYTLHFISLEAVRDLNTKISKTFSGQVSEIASTLIKDPNYLASSQIGVIETTTQGTKYKSNFWSPIQNLNYLLENAANANNLPSYVFYQNRLGFNFHSLDLLTDTKVSFNFKDSNYSSTHIRGGSFRDLNEEYSQIESFDVDSSFDYMMRVGSGMFGSRDYIYDIVLKRVEIQDYNLFTGNTVGLLNKYPLNTPAVPFTSAGMIMSDFKYYGNYNGYGDVTNVRLRQQRISLMSMMNAFKATMTVPGRIDYTVGMKINVTKYQMNIQTGTLTDADLDWVNSGNYIVSAINHVITKERHSCVMEIVKDSYIKDFTK